MSPSDSTCGYIQYSVYTSVWISFDPSLVLLDFHSFSHFKIAAIKVLFDSQVHNVPNSVLLWNLEWIVLLFVRSLHRLFCGRREHVPVWSRARAGRGHVFVAATAGASLASGTPRRRWPPPSAWPVHVDVGVDIVHQFAIDVGAAALTPPRPRSAAVARVAARDSVGRQAVDFGWGPPDAH